MKQAIGKFVEDAVTMFGDDVNKIRQLPFLYDGLKPNYRRIIFKSLGIDTLTKVANIIGNVLTLHPHGDESLRKPVSNLVRWGILDGQGNHGMKTFFGPDIQPAAPRYPEVKISKKYDDFFRELMPYVPMQESVVNAGVFEPTYLPTPYPICLTSGTLGIGVGVNTRVPAFTMESLHKAYINNDPNYLEAPFGLELDKEHSDLKGLWNTGIGHVVYKFKVYRDNYQGINGTMIEGEPEIFKPILDELFKLRESGKVNYKDLSSAKTGRKLFWFREYNIKSISIDDVHNIVEKGCVYDKVYRLTVADQDHVYLIPLKNWLDVTYKNYINLIEVYKADKISKLEFDYKVYKFMPIVAEFILKDRNQTPEGLVKLIN